MQCQATDIRKATLEELKTLTGIIYGIRNKIDGKIYIGQTKLTFRKRYQAALSKTASSRLRNAIKHHGEENFEILILESSISDAAQLDELEKAYAIQFNAYHPHGYNLMPCGNSVPDERRGRVAPYRFKDITTGEIFITKNLKAFCRTRGISPSIEYALRMGRGHIHSNRYTTLDTTAGDISNRYIRGYNKDLPFGPYTVWKGEQSYIFDDIHKFVKEHGLNLRYFLMVLKGTRKNHLGFSLLPNVPRNRFRRNTDFVVFDWIGNLHTFSTSLDMVKATGVRDCDFSRIISGVTVSSRGYSIHSYKRNGELVVVESDPEKHALARIQTREYALTGKRIWIKRIIDR